MKSGYDLLTSVVYGPFGPPDLIQCPDCGKSHELAHLQKLQKLDLLELIVCDCTQPVFKEVFYLDGTSTKFIAGYK